MAERNRTSPGEAAFQNQYEELRRRATKDALSGLLNRATMEQLIQERLQAMAPEETCALFIVDLDNFKQVNDTLGHQAGDQAIRQTAQILSRLFRASDIVGRLGGDEFAVFLCGQITEDLARKKAAAICENLHLVLGDRTAVNLTVSVGGYLADRGQQFEGLYQAADLALYKAKKAGKHGFCLKTQRDYVEEMPEEFRPVTTIPLLGLLEYMDSGVALLEMGPTPQVIYVSPSFCRLMGASYEDYPLPKALEDLIHPDDLVALETALREGLRQETAVEHIHRVAAGDGQGWLWWHVRAKRVRYDNPHPVMLITTTDISQFKAREAQLTEVNQRLQAAFDQTSKRIWEVDLATREFSTFSQDGTYRPLGKAPMYFPAHLVEGGWIHPKSVSRFQEFAQELLGGRAQGYGNFAVRNRDTGYYSWASVSYRVLFDDVGRAVRAVGVLEDMPQSRDGWSPAQRQLPEGLVADLIVRMCANLDLDTVESLWIEDSNVSGQVQETRCSQILLLEKEKLFGKQNRYQTYFSREHLMRQYQEGHRWMVAEYQRVDSSGNIRWVRHVVYLTEEPVSHQVYLFVYLIRLDPHHQLEKAMLGEIHRDPVSCLYDRETTRRMADTLFARRTGGSCAVAVFQINGLSLSPTGAGPDPDQMRYEIAAALSLTLGGSCLLGQYTPNQLVIVFPSVTEKEDLRYHMEEAVSFLRRMLSGKTPYDALRFLVGIHLMPAASANYDKMLGQAIRACAFWWNAAVDTVAFAQEYENWSWAQMDPDNQDNQVSVHSEEMARPLSAEEKDVALDCVSSMLTAKSLDASLQGVLQTIGAYYHADRVYTLILVETRHAVVMTYEWTSASKWSIQQAVSGMRLERFPLLERCLAERAPVFLTRQAGQAPEIGSLSARPWCFTAFPLIRNQEVEGFLCIENAREHPADAALFSTLIPYMMLQRERFHDEGHTAGTTEQLMGLPDLRAYMESIYTLTSDRYSSLGALCLDIPNFAAINSSHGFEYGSKLLWYVAKTLTDLFGAALLFRTWDAEFVIFLPNTTREVFLGRCGRLRSILQRRYPKLVRIGRVWAEGVFTGRHLVEEAKDRMQREYTASPESLSPLAQPAENYASVEDAIRDGRFTVYFQPKVDMRTGTLVGAEALVRGVGKDGSIIPPNQFIDLLEEEGAIRALDFFVLETALAQAEAWRQAGLGLVPVAVNLSRVTFVHPSTLASVLAVQSRYPALPPTALELEITERIGGIGTATFGEVVKQFRSCGLRVSLDDFGSQYANLPLFTNVKFDTVKLDRSLITGLVSNPINRMLVQDIVHICQTYDMTCVAEGVETQEQAAALLEMGCTYAQGFYYDKPLPAETFRQHYLDPDAPSPRAPQEEKQEDRT